MPLIVLSNKHILHFLYFYCADRHIAFVTFCESNAKALSTGYALSKVPLRPAGASCPADSTPSLTDGGGFTPLCCSLCVGLRR